MFIEKHDSIGVNCLIECDIEVHKNKMIISMITSISYTKLWRDYSDPVKNFVSDFNTGDKERKENNKEFDLWYLMCYLRIIILFII